MDHKMMPIPLMYLLAMVVNKPIMHQASKNLDLHANNNIQKSSLTCKQTTTYKTLVPKFWDWL